MRMLRRSCSLLVIAAAVAAVPRAHAAEVTRVASSPWEGPNRFDVHFGVAYTFRYKRAAVLREWNSGGSTDSQNRLVKDLLYQQQRHELTPMVEVGLWRRLALYVQLPIVLADNRTWEFDRRADDCVFGSDVPPEPEATCVDKSNSTTLRDNIVPRNGMDATNTTAPFDSFTGPNTALIFRGPARRGVDQLHLGLKYGILDQDQWPHLPNWTIAFDARIAVGRAMSFRRDITREDPRGNHRVGRQIHEIGLWTALSRRHRFLDPFFTAYWRQSIRGAGSRFQDFRDTGAQDTIRAQSNAGISFGTEIIPWERKARHLKVAIMLAGSADLHYGGRGYSEIWELLADSPALVGSYDPTSQALNSDGTPSDPAAFCDAGAAGAYAQANPGDAAYLSAGGSSCQPYEGITDIGDYATFGLNGGLNFQLGEYTRLALGVNLTTDTRHFITATGRGDADADQGGSDPNAVEPGTREVNPLRRDVVDNVGRRFAVDDILDVYANLGIIMTF